MQPPHRRGQRSPQQRITVHDGGELEGRGFGDGTGRGELTSAPAEKRPTGTAASNNALQPGGEGDGNGDEQQPGGVVFDLSGEETTA